MTSPQAEIPSAMEQLFGSELMTQVASPLKSTKDLLDRKDLVLLYFSASWCPPCKAFSPILKKFYTAMAKPAKLEIIYISSDHDVASFEDYYGDMPWLAVPFSKTDIKRSLAKQLHVSGIPTLVVLDVKTGFFISDNGRYDVSQASGKEDKMIEIIQSWKATQAVPFDQAVSSLSRGQSGAMGILSFVLKNPFLLFGIYFLIKQAMKHYSGAKGGGGAVVTPPAPPNVGGASTVPPPPLPVIDEDSEF